MPVKRHKSSRTPAAKSEIHKQAKHLKEKSPSLSWKEAHGVAKGMVTGKKARKKRGKK